MKKVLEYLLEGILVIVVAAIGLLVFLTINEYKPAEVEKVEVRGSASKRLSLDKDVSILSWNIGYSALGQYNDFVMDGGSNPPADKAQVESYYKGITETVKRENADLNIIQEADTHSARSFFIDLTKNLSKSNSTFAYNYKCRFVPFPVPPLAEVNSGILTTSDYTISSAIRKSVPCPFSWPLSTANLKRGLLVSYLPIDGSSHKLVLINLHLEAYTENEGRIAQLKILNDFMIEEYEKGNYVIAGGDFNQTFPGTVSTYPNTHKENWDPNELTYQVLDSRLTCVFDSSNPTCRLLNQPYNPSDKKGTQYYVIDGYIITPNIEIKSIKTLDEGFSNSDHNPVKMVFQLRSK